MITNEILFYFEELASFKSTHRRPGR